MLHTYANYVKNLKAMSTIILNHFIGHAAYYAWARAKQFCCHSVCLSVIMGSHFQVIKYEHCGASLSPLMGKLIFYCTCTKSQES